MSNEHPPSRTSATRSFLDVTSPRLKILPSPEALSMRDPSDVGIMIIASSMPLRCLCGHKTLIPRKRLPFDPKLQQLRNAPKAHSSPSLLSPRGEIFPCRGSVVTILSMMIQDSSGMKKFASSDRSNCSSDAFLHILGTIFRLRMFSACRGMTNVPS